MTATSYAQTLRLAIDAWTHGESELTELYLARFDEERRHRELREREVAVFLASQSPSESPVGCLIRRLRGEVS
jgi:hypothetical protein